MDTGEDSYQKLKTELIKRVGSTQADKTRQLLEREVLGDRTPSQFLRHLRSLAGDGFSEETLGLLWASRLPIQVRTHIAASEAPLDYKGQTADAVYNVWKEKPHPHPQPVASATEVPTGFSLEEIGNMLKTVLSRLGKPETNQISETSYSRSARSRSRSRPRSRNNRAQSRNRGGLCWYHWKFAASARKCEQPCSFQGNEPVGH